VEGESAGLSEFIVSVHQETGDKALPAKIRYRASTTTTSPTREHSGTGL